MKVSVIIPVWNVEKYLEKCLDSVVNQTLQDIEIIVVNDGSPDNSQTIIDRFKNERPTKITALKVENGGQGVARNIGLDIAKGEYISFIDSDDWIDLDMLEVMYNEAINNNCDVVVCDMVDHYPTYDVYHDCTNFKKPLEKTPSACNKIFSRKFINNVKFVGNRLWYEDFNWSLKLLPQTKNVGTISRGMYHCTCREVSTMTNNNSVKNLDIIEVIEDAKKYAKEVGTYSKEQYEYLIYDHILITSINRVAKQINPEKKRVLKELLKYVKENIANLSEVEKNNGIALNRRIIAFLNYHGLWNVSAFILNLKGKTK